MTTEMKLHVGSGDWTAVRQSVAEAVGELRDGQIESFVAAVPERDQAIDASLLEDGTLRLAVNGNDGSAPDRLTVRDERAVIAVGFSVASAGWGSFYWDWTPPFDVDTVASGIVRTIRDIYKAEPGDVELVAHFGKVGGVSGLP